MANEKIRTAHPADDRSDPQGFGIMLARFLEALAVRKYSDATVDGRRRQLTYFIAWAAERDLTRPKDVSRAHLERYQRYLHHYRKEKSGEPLALRTQQALLNGVRVFFAWLAKHHWLLYNPASELELPRIGTQLPRHVLSAADAERVIAEVNLAAPLGLRDRAILETLYSTGIRRTELSAVKLYDVDRSRGTLRIRHGKGKRERVVPIGERALSWIEKYRSELRPQLRPAPEDHTLFLLGDGRPITPAAISTRVARYLKQAGLRGHGSCHLFRHTAATLMLENGADIRYIQAILGHAELSTTEIYTKVSIQKLKAIHTATHPAALLRRPRSADEEPQDEQRDERLNEESEHHDTTTSDRSSSSSSDPDSSV